MPQKHPKITKDDVQSLSRGHSSRSKCGSKHIPHRLTQRERIKFQVAQKRGFLKMPINHTRDNLINIYRLWCESTGQKCIIVGEKYHNY